MLNNYPNNKNILCIINFRVRTSRCLYVGICMAYEAKDVSFVLAK